MFSYRSLVGFACTIALLPPIASWVIMTEGAIAQTNMPVQSEADRLESLGKQQQQQALYSEARETFQKLVKLRREMGDRAGEAEATGQLAKVYGAMGLGYQELESYQTALKLFRELKDQRGEVNTLKKIAHVYYLQRNYQEALNIYQTVLAIPNISSQRSSMRHALMMMAAIYQQQGNLNQALEKAKQGLQISPQPQSSELLLVASIYSDLGNFREAIDANQNVIDAETQKYNDYNYSRGVTVKGIRYLCKEYQVIKSLDIENSNFQGGQLEKSNFSTVIKLSSKGQLEKSSVSRVVKLNGITTIGIQGRTGSDIDSFPVDGAPDTRNASNQINMIYSTNLALTGVFSPRTRFIIGLQSGKDSTSPFLSQDVVLSYEGNTNGQLRMSNLAIQHLITPKLALTVGAGGITPITIFRGPDRFESATTGSLGLLTQRNPNLNSPGAAGLGLDWQATPWLRFQDIYTASSTAFNPTVNNSYSPDGKISLDETQIAECSESRKIPVGNGLNLWREPIQSFASSSAYTISTALNNLGAIYNNQGNPTEALKLFLKADTWAVKTSAGLSRSTILGNIATLSLDLGDLSEAKENARKSLQLAQKEGPLQVAQAYQVSGRIYSLIGDNATAILVYKKALAIANASARPSSKALSLIAIGNSYSDRGDLTQSLSFLNQALEISQSNKLQMEEIQALDSLGILYRLLGQFDRALVLQKDALRLSQDIGTIPNIVSIMTGIASVYYEKGEVAIAEKTYREALEIAEKTSDFFYTSKIHLRLAKLKIEQKQLEQALEHVEKGLIIQRKIGIKGLIAQMLDVQGQIQTQLNQPQAESNLQQSIALHNAMGNSPGEASSKASLATYYAKRQPELAIALYKSAVQHYEEIRKGLASLPKDQQQSYTDTVAKTYRTLAALLLQNDRILEARQVIELLKLQELNNYSRDTRGQSSPLSILKAETGLLNAFNLQVTGKYTSLFQASQELETLRSKTEAEKTPAIQKRIRDLETLETQGNAIATQFLSDPTIKTHIQQLQNNDKTLAPSDDNLNQLTETLASLKQSNQTAAIFYPLIFDDRLEILLITPNGPPLHRTVKDFDRLTFNETVQNLSIDLTDIDKNPQPNAQRLYQWLIKPIEADLKEAGINTLIYSPDRRLRSVPLAALHDGQQWLIEKYQISHITATSATNLTTRRNASPKVLSGTISDQSTTTYNVKLQSNLKPYEFNGLPSGKVELNAIGQAISGSKSLIETDFSSDRLRDNAGQYNILHLATHGYFELGQPENSFLLFSQPDSQGKNYATITDIRNWKLRGIDLVTLSACQTAVAPEQLDTKLGILGISHEFERAGAKSTIASLWRVNDRSTALLMQAFYQNLSQGKTKAEALKNAQNAMLHLNTDDTATQAHTQLNRSLSIKPTTPLPITTKENTGYSHPYYWAPFILIGNSL
jgi:CHAT domain-containing protein/Tfp pilus assembly protein PilF